jgi:hypothetical protein
MATVLQDDFSDANGTNISGKALDVGGNWTVLSGTWRVQGGLAEINETSGAFRKIHADAGAADVTAQVDFAIPAGTGAGGLILRSTDDINNWWVYASSFGDTIKLYEYNAGGLTERATAAHDFSAATTYEIKAELSGNNIEVFIDDVSKFSYGSASFQNTATRFGLISYRDDADFDLVTFDNFLVTTPSVASAAPPPFRRRTRFFKGR